MQYSDWSAHGGSQMFRDAKANGARLVGGTQYVMDADGQYQALSSRGGQVGYWKMNVNMVPDAESSDGLAVDTEMVFKVMPDNSYRGLEPRWVEFINDHYYMEAKGRATLGSQIAFTVSGDFIVPGPYVQGILGGYVNFGSRVLWQTTADNKHGVSHDQGAWLQGIGFTNLWVGGELQREQSAAGSAVTGKVVFFGILGIEVDSNRQLFMGLQWGAKWTSIIGIEGEAKSGFRFQF